MFRILVVEDDAELRELFRQVLGKNGYQAVIKDWEDPTLTHA